MKLASYIAARGMTLTSMAGLLGVSVEAVRRYAADERFPEPDIMARIREVTKGKVTERDFAEVAARLAERRAMRRTARQHAA